MDDSDLQAYSNSSQVEDPMEISIYSADTFTENQKAFLNKYSAINDSVLIRRSDVDPQMTPTDKIAIATIAAADARGFYDGFKYGWKHGRGILGKVSTASACAIGFSAVYSAIAAGLIIFGGGNPIPLITHHNAMGMVWETEEVNNHVNFFKSTHPDYQFELSDEELRIALVHNVILYHVMSGEIIPGGTRSKILSESQMTFFDSPQVQTYYNAVPAILKGEDSFENYCNRSIFERYPNEVANRYLDGLQNVSLLPEEEWVQSVDELSKQYIEVLLQDEGMTPEYKSHLISTCYLGNVSFGYWNQNINDSSK
ncbi:MAG: hypothetical protein K2O24_07130 [Muribaculaceae bacterium]|nr:hypothetical protein [Muribaculaceae bacterium]